VNGKALSAELLATQPAASQPVAPDFDHVPAVIRSTELLAGTPPKKIECGHACRYGRPCPNENPDPCTGGASQ
jgi:hypothetical protein